MRQYFYASAAMLLCACSQQAAPIASLGSQYFGQGTQQASNDQRQNGYAYYEPAAGYQNSSISSQPTVANAPLQGISARELEPPKVSNTNLNQANPPSSQPVSIAPQSSKEPAAETPTISSGFIQPTNGKVVARFGKTNGGKVNDGINIAAAEGEPVYAAAEGKVAYVGNQLKSYGNMVIIKHAGNKNTTYSHLSRPVVAKDAEVSQGQIIGYVGQSGSVSSPQLHFALREGSVAVDPENYLNKQYALAN